MPRQEIKQKELIILIISLLAFVILISLTTLYYRSSEKEETSKEEEPVVVEGALPQPDEVEPEQPQETSEAIGSEVFFLTPSADEILSSIRDADPYAEQPNLAELPPMKVMWQGFYYPDQELVEIDDEIIIQLDVDESGFGVILVCTINLSDYPEVKTLQPGQSIWVAGEVTELDMDGTGTVHISVEYIRFDDEPKVSEESSP